mmetsp:Transcript_99535/g.281707  ORF Transcript_99535/g.281707 Transcript_99535/m.281707 type:complete len:621 (-) Transcript_99535:116-1978(-)
MALRGPMALARPLAAALLAASGSAYPHVGLQGGGVQGENDFQVDPSVVGNMQDGQIPASKGMAVQVSRKHAQIAEIFLGTPPQRLTCLIDSGSSDLWVPSSRCASCQNNNDFSADASSTFQAGMEEGYGGPKPRAVKITYGSGEVSGYAAQDVLTFGSVTVQAQPFIIVEDAALPEGRMWDGICGLGWKGIAQLSPTLYESLQQQGQRCSFTVCPTPAGGAYPGAGMQMLLGEVPQSLIKPETLVWVPAEAYDPTGGRLGAQRTFWMVSGGVQINAPQPFPARFLVDTGTNQVLLVPQRYYQNFIRSLIPSQYFDQYCGNDPRAGVVCDCAIQQVQGLTPLKIYLSGRPFSMPVSKMFVTARTTTGGQMCLLTMQPNTLGLGGGGIPSVGDLLGGLLSGLLGPSLRSHAVKVPETTDAGLAKLPHLPFTLPAAIRSNLPWFKEDAADEDPDAREAVIQETVIENGQICQVTKVAENGQLEEKARRCAEDTEAVGVHAGQRRLQYGSGGGWADQLLGGIGDRLHQHLQQHLQGSLLGNLLGGGGLDPYGQQQAPYGQQQQAPVDDEPWMIGGMFLENFATVFDFDQGVMGFAEPAGSRRLAQAPEGAAGAAGGRRHAEVLV